MLFFFFFFQAEDGIRDKLVTGVQTCALPISQRAHAIVEALGIHDLGRSRRAVFRDPSRGPAVHDERDVAALLEPATPLPRRRQHTLTAVEQYHGGKPPRSFPPVDLPRHLSRPGGPRGW